MRNPSNVKPREMERVLLKAGFIVQVSKSSHRRFRHPDGRRTVLAYHPGNIPKPIVMKILKQADLNLEDFEKLLKS